MISLDIEQRSPEWFAEKLGKPSASNASKIITNSGAASKQQEAYMYELAAEIITGKPTDSYTNPVMQEGIDREEESRQLFELACGVDVQKVGLIYKDAKKMYLCSPDGIVKDHYGVELKNVLPKTQVKYLLDGTLPSEYFSQVQMSMLVTGFDKWAFMSYSPGLKPLLIEVKRDQVYIDALEKELDAFCHRLSEVVRKIK